MRKKYTPLDNILSGGLGILIALPICYGSLTSWSNYSPSQEKIIETKEVILLDQVNADHIEEIPEIIEEIPEPCIAETEEEIDEEIYYDSLELLAQCVEAEAGNQDLEGKRLVVDTILNRVDDPDFPNTIIGVITQPYHFTAYWSGVMDRIEPSEETYEAVRLEIEDRTNYEILFFTAGGYSRYGTPWDKVGDHYFSTK